MFDDLKDAISYIESKRTKRTFLDFQALLTRYHFDTNLKNVIHVAGTNGKGSTTVMMRDLLRNHGYHVGTFTSPYIINPSPLSAYRGFFGSKPFSKTNQFLMKNGLEPIDWSIQDV